MGAHHRQIICDVGHQGPPPERGLSRRSPAELLAIEPTCKVFVAGLTGPNLNEVLQQHFSQVGEVIWVELMPRGTACIAYARPEEALKAREVLSRSALNGAAIHVDRWKGSSSSPGGWKGGPTPNVSSMA